MFFFCALRLTTYILVATDQVSPSHTATCCSSLSAREPLPSQRITQVTGTLRIGDCQNARGMCLRVCFPTCAESSTRPPETHLAVDRSDG